MRLSSRAPRPAQPDFAREVLRGLVISVIYLVRHGETAWNWDSRIQGHSDIPLNDRGMRQAEALAARLAAVPLEIIYTSDLSRARVTAELIARRQPRPVAIMARPELRECDYGSWEGLTRPEAAARFPEEWRDWQAGEGRPTGGEDIAALAGRTGRIFAEAVGNGKGAVLISAHRGSLRTILCHALGIAQDFRDRFDIANCSVSALECPPAGRPLLQFLNDTCHLEGV
ncbi:MAG: histidine phosphatase family protein [Syntrophales bacterium]